MELARALPAEMVLPLLVGMTVAVMLLGRPAVMVLATDWRSLTVGVGNWVSNWLQPLPLEVEKRCRRR